MPLPDLIIFDCDGVLIDSEVLSADVLIAELACIGVSIDRAFVRDNFLGRSFPTVARAMREDFATHLPDDFEQRYRTALLARFETELQPTAGIDAVLSALGVPCCVATSSSPPRVARSLAMTRLDRHFGGHVYTASQVARGKPFPDLFLFAANEMGVAPDRVLVVEDSAPGLAAAAAAGMRAMAYLGGSHWRGGRPALPPAVTFFDNWADFPHLLTGQMPEKHAP